MMILDDSSSFPIPPDSATPAAAVPCCEDRLPWFTRFWTASHALLTRRGGLVHGAALLLLCFCSGARAEDPAMTEQAIAEWIKTERLIGSEKIAWEQQKARSEQLISLYQKELALLDEELNQTGQGATQVDKEAQELKERLQRAQHVQHDTLPYLAALKPQVLALLPQLPTPLQDQLQESASLLQEEEVTLKNGEASLRAIITILEEAARFDRNYVFEEHLISLDGEPRRAEVMYLGLGAAFFRSGSVFGQAHPSPQGWVFQADPALQDEIEKAFAVKQKTIPSSFFKLPLSLTPKWKSK